MKRLFTLLIAFTSFLASAQVQECEFTDTYSISAPSGMKMRTSPTVASEVVTYVMFDSIVEGCIQSFGEATFEEISGHWVYVRYKGKTGYMFDGFLKKHNDIAQVPLERQDSTVQIDSVLARVDSTSFPSDTVVIAQVPEEPLWTWKKTERDEIPATGRLDSKQIQDLAAALRHQDLRMDSLIGFLHQLPTLGSQDSVIAWIAADMPEVGKSKTPSRTVSTTVTEPIEAPGSTEASLPPAVYIQMATEALNYCGDITELDPSMNWYGVFPNDQMGSYELKRVDLEILVSRTRLGSSMEYDIRNSTEEASHFLFGINRRLDTVRPFQLAPNRFFMTSSKLFPGQQLETYANYNRPSAANVFISATGRVIEVGACPVIEDYALKINTQGPSGEIIQDITPLFESLGECGMPEIYWFGDLNQDNYPELIYVSATENKNVFTLLMSNVNLRSSLYEVGSTWTLEKCE